MSAAKCDRRSEQSPASTYPFASRCWSSWLTGAERLDAIPGSTARNRYFSFFSLSPDIKGNR